MNSKLSELVASDTEIGVSVLDYPELVFRGTVEAYSYLDEVVIKHKDYLDKKFPLGLFYNEARASCALDGDTQCVEEYDSDKYSSEES